MLSNTVQNIKPSSTLELNAKAIQLQKQGVDVIRFVTGESDLGTPKHIGKAGIVAIEEGFDFYTAASGITELKIAICNKLKRDNQIDCDIENVMISNGGKQALFNCFAALLNPSDEVIIPSPYWVSYVDMVQIWSGVPKMVDTSINQFKLTAEMVNMAITNKTKVIILNSPSNPTGAVMDEEEIKKIAQLALEHNIYVISDEVYEYFLYDDAKMFSIGSIAEMKDLVFTVNAVSKTYGMTGWRIGYIAGPKNVIKGMGNLQAHSTSNPCSIAQKAALTALNGPQECIQETLDEFTRRRDFVYEEMSQIPGFKLDKPKGAFYVFPDVSAYFNREIKNSFDFAKFLLKKAHVALAPGGAFGKEGDTCIRLSYAASMENLKEGIKRIKEAVASLSI